MPPLLYAAYGSNLDHDRMRGRCAGAEPAGIALLPGWRLVLRRYADIVPEAGALLPIGLWRIRPRIFAASTASRGPRSASMNA